MWMGIRGGLLPVSDPVFVVVIFVVFPFEKQVQLLWQQWRPPDECLVIGGNAVLLPVVTTVRRKLTFRRHRQQNLLRPHRRRRRRRHTACTVSCHKMNGNCWKNNGNWPKHLANSPLKWKQQEHQHQHQQHQTPPYWILNTILLQAASSKNTCS